MQEQGKISKKQLQLMLVMTVLGTSLLVLPTGVTAVSKQDAWLSLAAAGFVNLYTAVMIISLSLRFPGRTFIQYLEDILGRYGGKFLAFAYLLFFIRTTSITAREYSEFLATTVMPDTPMPVFIVGVILMAGYAVYNGVEVVGRTAEIFVPFVIVPFLVLIPMVAYLIHVDRLLPVFSEGILPVVKGSMAPIAFGGEILLAGMLLPYLNKPEEGKQAAVSAVITIYLVLIVSTVLTITVFGTAEAGVYRYSAFELSRVARFGPLDHLDPVGVTIWVAGGFIKISVFYYVTVLATAQWLELRDYRPLVWPYGLILVSTGYLLFENINQLGYETARIFPFLAPPFEIIIPGLLFLVVLLKGGSSGRPS